MKKLLLTTISLGVLLVSCNNNNSDKLPASIINIDATANGTDAQNNADKPEITFDETTHNFGVIKEGEKVSYSFKFKNTGKSDLLIVSANASCGCTVPEYPKGIIKPGEEGFVKVVFDSKGKVGVFEKTITLTCNTEIRETVLTIAGEVVE
ncbi:MAG: DUF1573 domain-containing protein [Bacteroidia bacterium]|nr:DUF1573 domain-containing protein [Bacteroidia bacterium]MBP9688012.1 DUF1573 domain-containing protein [Bacteroidia bacterium]